MTDEKPTNVRRQIVAISMAMAFLLYLDRICLAEIVKSASFHADVALPKEKVGSILGIFFLAYALFQIPAGWISDRWGPRAMLTGYILLWSLSTALTGLVSTFPALLAMRFLCGAGEAGAYPASGAVIRRWIPLASRARANSLVIVGGRTGGALAPFLTAWLVVSLGHWRPALWIDGAAGLAVAAIYWRVVRNRPMEHPGCNEAERALIGRPPAEPRLSAREWGRVLREVPKNRNVWLIALVLFLLNLGSSFLITWLPTYLKEQKQIEDLAGGRMVTLVLAFGTLGALAGGWLTDRATRRLGLRRGRMLAFAVPAALAGSAYVGCLFVTSAWGTVACCGIVAFGADMGNPVQWSFLQDIGGRITAAVFGWANMCGNFGAALTAMMVPWLTRGGAADIEGHRHVFMVCAGAFFLAGLVSLGLDASKPVGLKWAAVPLAIPV